MALKALLFLLASFLLVSSTRVSSQNEEHFMEPPYAKVPPVAPAQSPLKALPPPANVTAKAPPPANATVKAPPPALPSTPPTYSPTRPPRTRIECVPLCSVRCKFHSRKNVCLRVCLTCCDRCKCVPPGQYGNREMCGKCYASMTTRGGKLKCP